MAGQTDTFERRQRFSEMAARDLVDIKFLADRLTESTILGLVSRGRAIDWARERGAGKQGELEEEVGAFVPCSPDPLPSESLRLIEFLEAFDNRSKAQIIVDEMEAETNASSESNRSKLLGIFEFFQAESLDKLTEEVMTIGENAEAEDRRDRGRDPETNSALDTPLGQAEGGKIKDVIEEQSMPSQFSDDDFVEVAFTVTDLREYIDGTLRAMKAGISIPIVADKRPPGAPLQFSDAVKTAGWVKGLRERPDGSVVLVAYIPSDAYRTAIKGGSIHFTSPDLREDYEDGKGRKFGQVISQFNLAVS